MNPLYILIPFAAILTLALALGTGIFITRRFGLNWRLYWIGALTFVGSQVLHIPFNSYVLNPMVINSILPVIPESLGRTVLIVFLFGLSAGLFEETARYLVFARWIKDDRTWRRALLFGAGHGGIEAIILAFLVLMTYLQLMNLQGKDLSLLMPTLTPEQLTLAQTQVSQYWSMPWLMSMMGFVERVFTLPLHIANAVLVLQVFRRNQVRWLWLAVGWHTFVNFAGLMMTELLKAYSWAAYATEGMLGLLALVSLWIILRLRSPEPAPEPAVPLPPVSLQIAPIVETEENLDQTKYG